MEHEVFDFESSNKKTRYTHGLCTLCIALYSIFKFFRENQKERAINMGKSYSFTASLAISHAK